MSREPTKEMIDRGVAFALNVKLGGDYTWSRYVADLYRHMDEGRAKADEPQADRIQTFGDGFNAGHDKGWRDCLKALEVSAKNLPDDEDMIEHNPDEGQRYLCCGAETHLNMGRMEHASDCWFVQLRAALSGPTGTGKANEDAVTDGWVQTSEKLHPDKPGVERYEQIPCLILRNGDIHLRVWNCEHLVWDDETGDDFYCEARDVTAWMIVRPPAFKAVAAKREGGER